MAEMGKTATKNKKDSNILANLIGGEEIWQTTEKKEGTEPKTGQ
jgi:hypothetical protein